ncbi:MAG: hypothetical protein ACOY5B_04690 [Spirochaetota bacterium]
MTTLLRHCPKKFIVRVSLILSIVIFAWIGCSKEKQITTPAKTPERAKIIRAYFNTPLKAKAKFDGFWSVDAKEYAEFLAQSQKSASPAAGQTRYFLRIEGSYCDELYFVDGGDFTMSAGKITKLEAAKGRTAYSVTFNRQLPGGIRENQGAILTVFQSEKRLLLEFPNHKLTFFPEPEKPASLAEQFTAGF